MKMPPPIPHAPTTTSSNFATLDGLPKQFVVAMRTLFDIMDDKGVGFVKFSEIENRWQDDGTKGLPKGVIESLQKVTPPNGLLSFERFCAGLKICLLKNQVEGRTQSSQQQPPRPPSAPLLDTDCKPQTQQWSQPNTATVRPNNTVPLPEPGIGVPIVKIAHGTGPLLGPPKPPRTAAGLERANQLAASSTERIDRAEIRTALQNWQLGLIGAGRIIGDGKSAILTDQNIPAQHKKVCGRRREPRRHTLQNGIDYNMLKRMKQIEQEKEVLAQGLQAVDTARDWYLKQISAVQEKMKYLGRMGSHMEQWSEAQQERLELQRARVFEVNRHLAALTDSRERGGLPLHMNLALNHRNQYPAGVQSTQHTAAQHTMTRLKQQNHMLSEELNKKGERITTLEREKAALARELFHSRSQLRRPDRQGQSDGFM